MSLFVALRFGSILSRLTSEKHNANLNFPHFGPSLVELLVDWINAGMVRRDRVGGVDRDVVVDGELSVELHPLDEKRHVVELVRLEVLEHVRKPPELMPVPKKFFVTELKNGGKIKLFKSILVSSYNSSYKAKSNQ